MKLSPRLAAVVSFIPQGSSVADIGSDHAQLPIYLAKKGISTRIIAGEINREPFYNACKAVEEAGVNGPVEVRLGYGLNILLPGEVDIIVMAGMGGATIVEILRRRRAVADRARRLILQPMVAGGLVRRWLLLHGFIIGHEQLVVEDEQIYEVIIANSAPLATGAEINEEPFLPVAPNEQLLRDMVGSLFSRKGCEPIPLEVMLEVGPLLFLREDPMLARLLVRKIARYRHIMDILWSQPSAKAARRWADLQQKVSDLEKVLYCLSKRKS
ncbi:MAG: tRNA (adenine(22)-N(1))-methyltransferase [Syntrophothermus sp.]